VKTLKRKKDAAKWNISVAAGTENKNDFESSGERNWNKSHNCGSETPIMWFSKKKKMSKTEHGKFCLKKGRPLLKLKY